MSGELVPGGGGAVVPAGSGGGGAAGDYVGDISMERGGTPGAIANPQLMQDLKDALGFDIGPEQIQKAREVMQRNRQSEDQRQKHAVVAAMRAEWGSSNYDARIARISDWLSTLPKGLAEAILGARDDLAGDAICNKPAVLRAMYEVAAAAILVGDDERDKAAAERALQVEWKSAYHSHIASIQRYLDTVPRSVREGLLNARDDNDVAVANDPQALKWLLHLARPRLEIPRGDPAPDRTAINDARRREIEKWMGAPKGSAEYQRYYGDAQVQEEYRSLIGQGAAGDAIANTADADVARRIAEIESWMGTPKYTRDEAVQRELRELYDRRERAQKRK